MSEDLAINFKPLFTLNASNGDESFGLGVYRGSLTAVIFSKGKREPIVKQSIKVQHLTIIQTLAEQLLDAGPETMKDFEFAKWVPSPEGRGGTWAPGVVIVLKKDEKNIFQLEISSETITPAIKFQFKTSGSMKVGGKSLSEELRSRCEFKHFLKIINDILVYVIFSNANIKDAPKPKYGGGNNRPSSGGSPSSPGPSDYEDSDARF